METLAERNGSYNYEEQRYVADCHTDLKRKRHDFLHKLLAYYACEYDPMAIEDLDAKSLVKFAGNSQTRAGAA